MAIGHIGNTDQVILVAGDFELVRAAIDVTLVEGPALQLGDVGKQSDNFLGEDLGGYFCWIRSFTTLRRLCDSLASFEIQSGHLVFYLELHKHGDHVLLVLVGEERDQDDIVTQYCLESLNILFFILRVWSCKQAVEIIGLLVTQLPNEVCVTV